MKTTVRENYEAPTIEVVEVKTEGVICQSGGLQNYNREDEEDW